MEVRWIMGHTVEQIVNSPNDTKLKFVSEANGEDDCLYDTIVYEDGHAIGVISGGDILVFVAKLWRGYTKSYSIAYYPASEVIKEFEI